MNFREIEINNATKGLIVFAEGMVPKDFLSEYVIEPLMRYKKEDYEPENLALRVITAATFMKQDDFNLVVDDVTSGGLALFVDGYSYAVTFDMRQWNTRSITEPDTERVVRGPHEGFVETLRINLSMLRRKVKSRDLVYRSIKLGKQTKTEVVIAYIHGIAEEKVLEEVKKRLDGIDMDSILDSGYVEEMIEDNPLSIFPSIGNSEKPDKVAAKLLEGRVAIMVEGSPMVLTAPNLFVENFQSAEDYYSRPYYASFLRILRYFAFLITVYLPAIYIAMTTYHQELLPYGLMLSAVQSENNTPFPTSMAVLIMIIIYEMLREGGVRLPQPAGHAISIVGALIIGDAAVSAGLISELVVIVVAFTAISSFLITPLLAALSLLRFFYIILASFSGFFGIIIGTAIVTIFMMTQRSFGVPYLMPYSPYTKGQLRDSFVRFPWWMQGIRPFELTHNLRRQGNNQMPKNPDEEDNK